MAKFSGMTPEGTSDLLFRECEARRMVEKKLTDIFANRGYSEVITPSLEFFDVFSGGASSIPEETMYKFIDRRGRILVLRPDSTLPIARIVSTKLRSFSPPLRLYYNQNVYRVSPSMTGRRDEVAQCGIELIGASGKKADLEIISTAVSTLKSVAAPGFRLEIGHVDFYKSLIDGLPFETQVMEQIRGFIEAKNYAALATLLEPYGKDNPSCRALLALPRLFGGEEVFGLALSVAPNESTARAVEYLRELYSALCELGLRDDIMIDFGLVNQVHYYSGVVFRGFMQGSGETMLSGGRYDSLLSAFGSGLPAIGFAVNTDAVAKSVPVQKRQSGMVLVFYTEGHAAAAFAHQEQLTEGGIPCEMSVFDTLEQTKAYARVKRIQRIDVVDDDLTEIELES